jgi:predicted type IV restriction endonuclease
MTPPAIVGELVQRFDEHREAYQSGQYGEAQLREEFVNPLFEALGWDIYNRKGYTEAYKEVIHEAAIKVGGRTKAPDYCFRAGGGKASFFVEAKRSLARDKVAAVGGAFLGETDSGKGRAS